MTANTSDVRQGGFSLIELVVAMAVTLVITGAVYGLLAGGQNAFRREPELTDRQQNIRAAMDLIMRDVANAGSGLPAFTQTFTIGLDACSGCPNGGAPMGPDNVRTDELELITNNGARDNEPVCHTPGGSSSALIRLVRGNVTLPTPMIVVLMTEDGSWTIREVVATTENNTGAGQCVGGSHTQLNVNSGTDTTGLNRPSGVCVANGFGNAPDPCNVTAISFASIVRYRIRNDASGVPVLQRWSSDDLAGFAGGLAAAGGFQTIATGIEDLQVQYTTAGTPTPVDGAPTVVPNSLPSLINQVRVTLGARSSARNIQGAVTSTSGGTAIRGRLTSTGSPRSTLINLSKGPIATQPWR